MAGTSESINKDVVNSGLLERTVLIVERALIGLGNGAAERASKAAGFR